MLENLMEGWTVKRLADWIFGLIILDFGLTSLGLKMGVITEKNPLIQKVMTASPLITSCLVFAFVWWALVILKRSEDRRMFDILGCVFFAKLGVMILHLNWIVRMMI